MENNFTPVIPGCCLSLIVSFSYYEPSNEGKLVFSPCLQVGNTHSTLMVDLLAYPPLCADWNLRLLGSML